MSPDQYHKRLESLIAPSSREAVVRGFLHHFSLVFAASLLLLYVLLEGGYQNTLEQTRAEAADQLSTLSTLISSDFEVIGSDVATLVSSQSLEQFLAQPDAALLKRMGARMLQFSEYRKLYDQIRLIDDAGNEVLRVNYNDGKSALVAQSSLQNKADRYYFKLGKDLEPGQIYLSPMDLNVENGEIEVPYKPMMRVATPIFDAAGNRWGILVLNYFAQRILDRVQEFDHKTEASIQLVNADGFWLYHPNPELRWGFMRGIPETNFADSNPRAWRSIQTNPDVQDKSLEANTGRVFAWLRPTDWINNTVNGSNSVNWLLVSEFPVAERLSTKYLAADPKNLWIAGMFLMLMGLGSWFYSMRRLEKVRWRNINQLAFQSMEQNPAALMITDSKGLIVYTNHVFYEITGYTFEEVVGKKTSLLKSGYTPLEVYESMWLAINRGKTWQGEIQNRKADGTTFWARLSISPIYNINKEITHYLCVEEDVTDRVEFQDKLHYIATHDVLTDVENRRAIMDLLKSEMERGMRYKHPLTVILMDIDDFKQLNDSLGHMAGDQVLKEFAQRLSHDARASDRVGRFGGEEFLVVLPETDVVEARGVAQRLLASINSTPFDFEDQQLAVTVSAGCVTISQYGDISDDIDSLLKRADEKLYEAKDAGKNRVCFDTL